MLAPVLPGIRLGAGKHQHSIAPRQGTLNGQTEGYHDYLSVTGSVWC